MGRWSQYDEDDYRLPEGMKRVGYDADTGKFYFHDRDGTLWEGAEGARYGEMRRVSGAPAVVTGMDESGDGVNDLEAASGRADGYQPLAVDPDQPLRPDHGGSNSSAYRMLFPFFLLIVVALLLVFRLIFAPSRAAPGPPDARLCPGTSEAYRVKAGDTCWGLSQSRNCSLDGLLLANPGLECDNLIPGQSICLPRPTSRTD
ncbi:hypothetical protein AcW1_001315 [Taiwanofungus camphoratus]|nr:hypothetical protein AcW2_000158 [Antrodia cinnamomea]KAI0937296.1 hypothetical protein AcV5_005237 [Antrodia cinnamomea]KAI0962506.1 hypothetical protein AcV7_001338 [Antrodia cinnamomea]KAI0964510.1 hypothetical protein AcW1_001315 [Antrodia cinnamomea]